MYRKTIPNCIPVSGPLPASVLVGLRIWEAGKLASVFVGLRIWEAGKLASVFVGLRIWETTAIVWRAVCVKTNFYQATNSSKRRTASYYCYHRVSKLLSNRPPACKKGTIPDQKQECKLEWPNMRIYCMQATHPVLPSYT